MENVKVGLSLIMAKTSNHNRDYDWDGYLHPQYGKNDEAEVFIVVRIV